MIEQPQQVVQLQERQEWQEAHILTSEDVRALRKRIGVKQAQVARSLHFSSSYICEIERGKRRLSPALANAILGAILALRAAEDEQREQLHTRYATLRH